jgi:signal transduction histidine kinase
MRNWTVIGVVPLLVAAMAGPAAGGRRLLGPERIDVFRPADGITALVQTRDGFLWVGTDRGLFRFDGVEFRLVAEADDGHGGRISALGVARDGGLWLALRPGSDVFYLSPGGVPRRRAAGRPPEGQVLSLLEDDRGALWAGTSEGLFGREDGRWSRYGPEQGLDARSVSALLDEGGGRLWVGTGRGLARRLEAGPERGRFVTVWEGARVHDLTRDDRGRIWAATSRVGVVVVEKGRARVFPEKALDSHVALAVRADAKGGVWVGTDKGPAHITDDETVVFDAQSFPDARTEVLAEDREGNVWAGTAAGGLVRIKTVQPLHTLGKGEGLDAHAVYSLLSDGAGGIWMTTDGGLRRWRGGRIENHGGPAEAREDFGSLAATPDGALWIASRRMGLFRYQGGRFTALGPREGMPAGGVNALHADAGGRLWIGLADGDLAVRDGERIRVYPAASSCQSPVNAMAEDPRGDLWLATDGSGLCHLERASKRFRHVSTKDGLTTARLDSLTFDREGALWIGTRLSGLIRFQGGRFASVSVEQGLAHEHVANVLEDASGHLWLTSLAGLFRIDKRELIEVMQGRRRRVAPLSFGIEDGMRTRHCLWRHTPGALRAPDGALWIPTARGVAVLPEPDRMPPARVPDVFIERVALNGGVLSIENGATTEVPAGRGNLEVQFTAPMLANAHRLALRYRLAGLDDEWTAAGDRRVARYASLPPGRYTFVVAATTSDGRGREKAVTVALTLAPPWTASTPFRLLMAAALAAALAGALRGRRWQLRRRAALLQEDRNRIARDLHDGLEQTFVAVKMQLEAGNLARASDLLDRAMAEARQSIWALRCGLSGAVDLPMALAVMAGQTLRGTEVKFDLQVRGTAYPLTAHAEQSLVRVVQEAITNALKHGPARSLAVELRFDDRTLGLTVRDDGPGFDPQDAARSSGGFGLQGMRERVAELGGELHVRRAAPRGTELELWIPGRWRRAFAAGAP